MNNITLEISKAVKPLIIQWKSLIKEYERQFEKGTISQNQFNNYIKNCNKCLFDLHESCNLVMLTNKTYEN